MKKMFFLFSISLGLFIQAKGQQKCLCDSSIYHIEQNWKPTPSKDSLVNKVVLASKNNEEFLCVLYKDGTMFSKEIPFKGKWRIHQMTNCSITLESKRTKILVFNLVTKQFSDPQVYKTNSSLYDPHNSED